MDLSASSLTLSSGTCFATRIFHLITGLRGQGINLENRMRNLLARACLDSARASLLLDEAITRPHYLVVDRRVACPRDMLP